MDEQAALARIASSVPRAGDDAAVVDDCVLTTDMLHASTDFPAGTTRYTAGWRTVAASLSDVAAMGATATAALAVYAAPTFEADDLDAFLTGAIDVCDAVGAEYVGGDLDHHQEFTVVATAVGTTTDPVYRSGASPGDRLCVTGTFGRSAAAIRRFDTAPGAANDLYQFLPRVDAGIALADHATAMLDSSDGLARSVHQLGAASGCGASLEGDAIPIAEELRDAIEPDTDLLTEAVTFGEDFELVAAVPPDAVDAARSAVEDLTVVGEIVADGVTLDGVPLPDTGYTHPG